MGDGSGLRPSVCALVRLPPPPPPFSPAPLPPRAQAEAEVAHLKSLAGVQVDEDVFRRVAELQGELAELREEEAGERGRLQELERRVVEAKVRANASRLLPPTRHAAHPPPHVCTRRPDSRPSSRTWKRSTATS